MNIYTPQKPLISIHIPKCAGTSFSNILKSWFNSGFLQHYHNEKKNTPPQKHRLHTVFFKNHPRKGLCIHGHFNNNRDNGVCDYYPKTDQIITVMRDPFTLHVSNYFYVKKQAQNAYWAGKQHPIISNDWSIRDYLREIKKSYICHFLPSNITIKNYQQILEEQFLYIGIVENLQKSVDLLAKKLGFSSVAVQETNVSKWLEKIPDNSREEFITNNPLEMNIYDYAKKNFGNGSCFVPQHSKGNLE